MLKSLLISLGLDEGFQQAYIRAATQGSAIKKTLLPQLLAHTSEGLESKDPQLFQVNKLSCPTLHVIILFSVANFRDRLNLASRRKFCSPNQQAHWTSLK
jgi:hypothetical protein